MRKWKTSNKKKLLEAPPDVRSLLPLWPQSQFINKSFIIPFSHHTSSQFCKARRFSRVVPPGRNVVLCKTDCLCDEKKELAVATQQELTLKHIFLYSPSIDKRTITVPTFSCMQALISPLLVDQVTLLDRHQHSCSIIHVFILLIYS